MEINNKFDSFEKSNDSFSLNKLYNYDKIMKYKEWLLKNGAVFDNLLEFPSTFGKFGIVGVKAKKNIKNNEAMLFIPKKLIIDSNLVCKQICLIDEKDIKFKDESPELLVLAVFLLEEYLKGNDSFWKPYIDIIEISLPLSWEPQLLNEFDDDYYIESILSYKTELKNFFNELINPIKYKSKLKNGKINKYIEENYTKITFELFLKFYSFVSSRNFYATREQSLLVPLADNLNHHNVDISYEVYDSVNYVLKNTLDFDLDLLNRLRKTSFKSFFSSCDGYTDIGVNGESEKDKVNSKFIVIESNKDKSNDKEINNMGSIDNNDKIDKIELLNISNKYNKVNSNNTNETNVKIETNDTDNKIENLLPKEEAKDKIVINKKSKNKYDLLKMYIKDNKDDKNKENTDDEEEEINEEEIGENEEDDDDEDYERPIIFNETDYFIISTGNEQEFKQGNQVFNFYGDYSNEHLLKWYGFTVKNNPHEKVKFKLHFCKQDDLMFYKQVSVLFKDCCKISEDDNDNFCIRFNLKDELNSDIINFTRYFYYYENDNMKDYNETLFNLETENTVIERVLDLLMKSLAKREARTTLEEDSYILNQMEQTFDLDSLSNQDSLERYFKFYNIIILRLGQKELFRKNIQYITDLHTFINSNYDKNTFRLVENYKSKEGYELLNNYFKYFSFV